MSQSLDQTNEPAPTNGGIQFYGGYQVYSESGIDLTLLRQSLELTVSERWRSNSRSAESLRAWREVGQPRRITQPGSTWKTPMLDTEGFLRLLNERRVEYVVIGGLAMIAHGSAYITKDMDICYGRSPGNLGAVATAFASIHPYLRGVPPGLPFHFDAPTIQAGLNFTLVTDLGDIDLLGEVSGVGGYEEALAQSVEKEIFGYSVRVLSIESLIASKKAAGRLKDRNHILELEELKKLRDVAP
jgi:hypothetical protein